MDAISREVAKDAVGRIRLRLAGDALASDNLKSAELALKSLDPEFGDRHFAVIEDEGQDFEGWSALETLMWVKNKRQEMGLLPEPENDAALLIAERDHARVILDAAEAKYLHEFKKLFNRFIKR